MSKRQWEVWTFAFPKKGTHPVVLISHPDRCAQAAVLNVLYCTSQRQSRAPYPYEVTLNSADGLSWETSCACDHIYSVESNALFDRRGLVSRERRRAIRRKLIGCFRLLEDD